MLTYSFENVTGSLYEYVYQCIKQDIIAGVIKPGEKLPSKRTFARNNGISTITIQNAYDQLVSEGYIYALEKRGYYVSEISEMKVISKPENVHYDIRIPEKKEYTFDFAGNKMNPDHFPFSIWARLSREVLSERKDDLMRISPNTGVYELREAIANHLKSFRGMCVDPNQIVIGAGTEYLYGILVQLLGRKWKYGIENPGYKKLVKIYGQYEVEPVYVDMDEEGVSMSSLKASGAQIAHLCPNHHFPTGITMPASRRYEVLSWANSDADRYIIEDDYDSEFRRNGKPIPTLFSIDGCEKVIYMNTFSKSLTPTIRVSYMVLPVHLANIMYDRLSFYSCTVSNFEQYILAAFINGGFFEKHINRMRLYYERQRKKIMTGIMQSELGKCSTIIESDSGLHFILCLDTDLSDELLGKRLVEKGIHIRALSEYYLTKGEKREHKFIIDYSNLKLEELPKAWETIYSCLFM